MNYKKKVAAIGVVIVVVFIALIKLVSVLGSPPAADVRFPERSDAPTVVLKDFKFQEKARLITYAPDKTTRLSMRIELNDGGTALVEFTKGKPVRLTQYFPTPAPDSAANGGNLPDATAPPVISDPRLEPLTERKVMRVTEFKADGISVGTQHTYLLNGSLKEVAVRTPEDNLLVTVFRDDLSGVERIQVFDKGSGLLKSERVFNEDGSVAALLGEVKGSWSSQPKQDFYRPDGTVWRSIVFSSYDVTISDYAEDGKTVTQTTSYGYGDVSVTTYDTAGVKKFTRGFNPSGTISVTYFDANAKQSIVQRWVKLDTTDTTITPDRIGVKNGDYVLQQVTEYMPDGYSVKRDVLFYPGGKVVKAVELRINGSYSTRTLKVFREDGSLDRVDEMTWSQVTKSTPMPAGPNQVRETLTSEMTRVTPLLPGPNPDKSDMPRLTKKQLQYSFD